MSGRAAKILVAALILAPATVRGDEPIPDSTHQIQLTRERSATLSAYFDEGRQRGLMRVRDGGLDWTSPVYSAWKVRVADLDGDGRDEVLLGVWSSVERHDEPAPHRAVWVLGWREDRLEALWRGSALARPLRDFEAADLDHDGRDELLSLERVGQDCLVSAYRWTGFGFAGRGSSSIACDAKLSRDQPRCVFGGALTNCYTLDDEGLHETR